MLQEAYRAAGSGAIVGTLLRSKLTPHRPAGGYGVCRAEGASGAPLRGAPLYSQLAVANRLVRPSYVSYETALHWYGLLRAVDERVIRSSCAQGRTRTVAYGCEQYCYICVPEAYYEAGVMRLPAEEPLYTLATPEKALCDLVLATPGLVLKTRAAVCDYLLGSLQVPEEQLCQLSPELVAHCAAVAHKKRTGLEALAHFLSDLGYYKG